MSAQVLLTLLIQLALWLPVVSVAEVAVVEVEDDEEDVELGG